MIFDRADPLALEKRLKLTSGKARKGLGQHFLVDRSVLSAMTGIRPLSGNKVVEVGPGPGILTESLLQEGATVLAFELDPLFMGWLRKDFPRVQLVEGNVLEQAAEFLPKTPYRVVANIPYGITNPLLRLFLERTTERPLSLTLLVQYEIAERLAAGPGKTGRGFLSVLAQHAGTVRLIRKVPATSFWPPPKVQSAVVDIELFPELPESTASYLHFVHRAFTAQRKQLKNVLAGIKGISADEVEKTFLELGFASTIRAQELSGQQWQQVYQHYA